MYFTGYSMVTRVLGKIREGINIVKEFDAAMTELIKVSNDSEDALFAFEKEAFKIASTIGSTGKEIVNSAAAWEKLGYAIKDASELAKNSALYSNVGDMDINTATEHMVSTLKAYKEFDAQSSSLIVDKFNEIGNNYAITSEGIGAALERSAATLVAAGK
jgi:TP901 family phage tail tape measure protein